MSKKKKQKKKDAKPVPAELEARVARLEQENEALRARLERIRELTDDLPVEDDEDEEYAELLSDVDDQIAEDAARAGRQP